MWQEVVGRSVTIHVGKQLDLKIMMLMAIIIGASTGINDLGNLEGPLVTVFQLPIKTQIGTSCVIPKVWKQKENTRTFVNK